MSLNLLPLDHADFAKEKYWDDFFTKLQSTPFEWYGEYDDLCDILDKYIRLKDQVLVVGCGNSKLSFSLYNVGFCNITNVDISATVIKQMSDYYNKTCPLMKFEKMDILKMSYEAETFNVVLDKGTLDAIMVNISPETIKKVDQMFAEISRVLKFGGRYICISLLQPHILLKALEWFSHEGWMIRVHRCFKAEKNQKNSTFAFPVFVVIFTKMKKMGSTSILEIAIQPESPPKRMDSMKEIIEAVKSIQQFSMIKHHISKRKVIENNLCLELSCTKTDKIKYRLFIVDLEKPAKLEYGIFIVPQGRETEWLFSTPEGRLECAANANCERLVIVHLLRDFHYENLDEVKRDLSVNVLELAPKSLRTKVPFLSLGDDLGSREVQKRGKSELSGEYVIEDTKGSDNKHYRRLIFLSNPYLVQSEAKLKKVSAKKKGRKAKWVADLDYLACDFHAAMISGLSFLGPKMLTPKILQIGLGGGGLAMYLYHHFPDADLEVVELDSEIVAVAKDWFGLKTDERLKISIADGLHVIKMAHEEGKLYDAVLLDVDSKDSTIGMSCPPPDFVSKPTLSMLSKLVGETGVVIINLSCRNITLKNEVYSWIRSKFLTVMSTKIPNEINEIVYCINQSKSEEFMSRLKTSSAKLHAFVHKQDSCETSFNVDDIIRTLKTIT